MAKASPVGDSITTALRSRMQAQGIPSFRALAHSAGISEGQILQFRRGNGPQMRLAMLQRLAAALQIDLTELLSIGGVIQHQPDAAQASNSHSDQTSKPDALKTEYARLQQQLAHQEAELRQRFQQDSLYVLEAWLKNWPRVVHAVQTDKPDLAAAKVLPLIKPLEQLLGSWNVDSIGQIGQVLPYDPQEHQLVQGQTQPGEAVTVSRPGYRQGDRLLHRAEVKAQG